MSKYSDWASLASHEEAIASGRMSGEALAAHPSLASLSLTGRRDAALAEMLARYNSTTVLYPYQNGAVGDGIVDDTAAVIACFAAASALGRACVDVTGKRYRLTSPVTVTGTAVHVRGDGGCFGGGFLKAHTGDLFNWTGPYGAFIGVWCEADTATNAAYGTSGWTLNFSSNSSGYGFRWIDGGSYNIDSILRFALDAGHEFHCVGAFLQQYTTTPGSEPDSILTIGDTTAGFRSFTDVWFPSKANITAAFDTKFTGCSIRSITASANTSIVSVSATILANNGNAHSVLGDNWLIQGCRISGSMTFGVGSNGTFIGNMFTSGSLTDNSGGYENWDILHRYEDSNHRYTIGPHEFYIKQPGVIEANTYKLRGDEAASLFWYDEPTQVWNAPIGADRAVTLNTSGGTVPRNGSHFRIVRTAAATGGFNLNVGSGPLKALAAGTWCDVVYNGTAWVLTGYGAL